MDRYREVVNIIVVGAYHSKQNAVYADVGHIAVGEVALDLP